MNEYFYKIWIPLKIATVLSVIAIFLGYIEVNWWLVFIAWFLIGPVGVGTGFHRLLSHRQFTTWKPVEYTLALLGTLSAYTPIGFFVSNHTFHHQHADTEHDPSTPLKGFWESFFWWRMREDVVKKVNVRNYCFRQFLRDDVLKFMSRYYDYIIYIYALILFAFGVEYLVALFILPTLIEHNRLNLISSMSHIKVPFSYRNFDTPDTSQNNYVFGILSLGFGWHNNHHQDQRELVNSHRWWEIDIEGLVGKALSKK